MNTVKIKAKEPYGVIIDKDAIKYLPIALSGAKKVLIVSDENVFSKFGKTVKSAVEKEGKRVYTFVFPTGEKYKSKFVLDKLLSTLLDINLLKSDCIIALGGGTVSDMAGFAAGIYKRGIPYINIPTTLLSMCDACVGGKTGVDFLGNKNLLGIFNNPKAVICDTNFLESLSPKEISSGFAEIIKCAMLSGKKAIQQLEKQELSIEECISFAISVKSKLIVNDERDNGERRLLNFGHTFGHAIESASSFSVSHGEAVAIGMVMACELAEKMKLVKGVKDRLQNLLKLYGLPVSYNVEKNQVWEYVLKDKKREDGKVVLVLPTRLGKCKVIGFSEEKIKGEYFGR